MRRAGQLSFGIALVLMIFSLAACGGRTGPTAAERRAAKEKQERISQEIGALQQQLASLDKEIADQRSDLDQHMSALTAASQQANNQLNQLKAETLGAGAATATPPLETARLPVANVPPERTVFGTLVRVIIAVLLLAVVFLLIKFAYSRLGDEEDDEDAELGHEGEAGEEYRNEMGSIRVSPEAQAAMAGEEVPGAAETPHHAKPPHGHVSPEDVDDQPSMLD